MNPLSAYVSEYAAALERQFAGELAAVTDREESARDDTDATVHLVEATANKADLPAGVLPGLDVAVRQFATQHGFELSRTDDGRTVLYEMYPSPAIDFPTEVPAR